METKKREDAVEDRRDFLKRSAVTAAAAGAVAAGDTVNSDASLDANTNAWYRRVKVTNLM